jgi:hypothetical protein
MLLWVICHLNKYFLMRPKQIALFACTNGYGHIKRLLLLSHALQRKGVQPTLFAPSISTKFLAKKEGISIPFLVDFDTNTAQYSWLNGLATDWIKKAPNLSKFDAVISDNLLEILKIRPDAWISGSFFWHASLKDFPYDLKQNSLDLLRKYKPKVISSKIFTSDEVKKHTDLYEVGIYTNSNRNLTVDIDKKNDLLIACGKGGYVIDQARKFMKTFLLQKEIGFNKVWVEPDIIPDNPPDWMFPANFSTEMYQSTLAAIVRPGVGTISNLIESGARIFPFYEIKNKEMNFNASRIKLFDLGEHTSSIEEAWISAKNYRSNKKLKIQQMNSSIKVDKDGANQAANIILKSL